MAHGPVVPQNFSVKQYSHENDISGVFDALHQSSLLLLWQYIVIIAYLLTLNNSNMAFIIVFSYWTYRKCHRDQTAIIQFYQRSACKRARLMTSHVNIYSFRRPLQNKPLKNAATMSHFLTGSCKNGIILLYRELSLTNALCCRADANINSLRLRRRELLFRNLPSNIMR